MKKRLVCCILFLCFLTVQVSLVPADAAVEYIRGDANGDGVVTVKDVTAIQRRLADLEADPSGMIAKRGNVAGNRLDIADATLIQKYLAEYGNPYQIGASISEVTQTTTKSYDLPFVSIP